MNNNFLNSTRHIDMVFFNLLLRWGIYLVHEVVVCLFVRPTILSLVIKGPWFIRFWDVKLFFFETRVWSSSPPQRSMFVFTFNYFFNLWRWLLVVWWKGEFFLILLMVLSVRSFDVESLEPYYLARMSPTWMMWSLLKMIQNIYSCLLSFEFRVCPVFYCVIWVNIYIWILVVVDVFRAFS